MEPERKDTHTSLYKNVKKIVPLARSLRLDGIFTKTATQLGIVATKASFNITSILEKEISAPYPIDQLLAAKTARPNKPMLKKRIVSKS